MNYGALYLIFLNPQVNDTLNAKLKPTKINLLHDNKVLKIF